MPAQVPQMKAGGTIRTSRFVKISTADDYTLLEADANERVFGVSTEAGKDNPIDGATTSYSSGDQMHYFGAFEVAKLQLGSGGATRGDDLKSDADGKGVTASSDAEFVGAIALQSGSEDELIDVWVTPARQRAS